VCLGFRFAKYGDAPATERPASRRCAPMGSGTTRTLARPACHARPPRVTGGFLRTAGVLLAPNFTRAFAMAVGNAKKRGSRRPDTCLATPTLVHTTRGPPTHPQQLRGSMSGRPPGTDLIYGASGGRCVAKRLLHRRQEDTWFTTRSLVITSPLHTRAGAGRGAREKGALAALGSAHTGVNGYVVCEAAGSRAWAPGLRRWNRHGHCSA
jgi:hypothetical protein